MKVRRKERELLWTTKTIQDAIIRSMVSYFDLHHSYLSSLYILVRLLSLTISGIAGIDVLEVIFITISMLVDDVLRGAWAFVRVLLKDDEGDPLHGSFCGRLRERFREARRNCLKEKEKHNIKEPGECHKLFFKLTVATFSLRIYSRCST